MRVLRPLSLAVVTALVATGCGLFADPVVSTEDAALDAILALRDGMEGRVTAELTVDEDEVRDALRDDTEARELLAEEFGDDGDVEGLLADLEDAQARLAEHALVVATGTDGSARLAGAWRGVVWFDLRGGTDLDAGSDLADGFRLDLQARVDWATVATMMEQPDLLGDLDEAAAEIAPFLGEMPDTDAIEKLVLGFLGGELVGVSGLIGPELLDGLGALGGTDGSVDTGASRELDLDPREALATALTIDGFRTDGGDTLADVTIELRAIGELLLDRIAEAPDAFGMTFDEVDEARTELRAAPERLTDVATLRFDGDGVLTQVRTDVLDVMLQAARAAAPDDGDIAVVERVAAQLDATGLFVLLDVESVGETPSVLGNPAVTVSPDELTAAFGAVVLGGLTEGLGAFPGGLEGLEGLEGLQGLGLPGDAEGDEGAPDDGTPDDDTSDDAPDEEAPDEDTSDEGTTPTFSDETLRPQELSVGDCFDDDVLFGFAPANADATVPCEQEHDNEAFATVETTAETYDDMMRNESDAVECIDAFEDYVGVPYAESELVVDVLRPSEAEFADGARTSVCYLYGFERLTGSMAGTGR